MSTTDFTAKYGELDGLFKKYCDKKKRESKSLRKQLEEEISTNVELRKCIVLLEAKLLREKDSTAELERLYCDAMNQINEAAEKRDNELRAMACDLTSRLLKVEQRERECTEQAAAIELREGQFWTGFNDFQKSKDEFERGLSACKKTMDAELQHSHEVVDVAKDCLCGIRSKSDNLTGKEQDLEDETLCFQQRMYLEQEERALRDRVIGCEFGSRCSLFGTFFHEFNLHQKLLLSRSVEKEGQLKTTTDLLHLHEVEFSTRVRKEKDLCQEERSSVELLRRGFAVECKNVLHTVTEFLDLVSNEATEALRVELEDKLQAMLQQSIRNPR